MNPRRDLPYQAKQYLAEIAGYYEKASLQSVHLVTALRDQYSELLPNYPLQTRPQQGRLHEPGGPK